MPNQFSRRSGTNRATSSFSAGKQNARAKTAGALKTKPSPTPEGRVDYKVTQQDELMKFLLAHVVGKGRNKIKSILARGQVTVDGQPTKRYDHPLAPGQVVAIHKSTSGLKDKMSGLSVLYEDDDIVVIDKPAGLLTIATEDEKTKTAYQQLTAYVRKRNPKNRIFIVHRLDRDTSGVMMFCKSEEIQQHLQNTWKESVVERTYVVLVQGRVDKQKGTITSWLKENAALRMYSSRTPNDGLKSITHYEVMETGPEFSLLKVNLETGRKNQIRVHMQDIGHPVAGDRKYGATKDPIGRLGLHAYVLAFQHPVTKEVMRFEAPVPKKFQAIVRAQTNSPNVP